MRSYSLHIVGLDELYSAFHKAGVNYEPVMKQAMFKATTIITNQARDNIRKNGTTFQGDLAVSIRPREISAHRGTVAVGEKYGAVVEFGRKPGKMPPVEPLERWAALKLGAPGAGFVIARKIKQKGTKPQPYMEPALREKAESVLQQFSDGAKIVVQMMGA